MNESANNPLNDFLNQAEEEPENNLFAPIPFPSQPEPAGAAVPVPPPVPATQAPAAEMPGIPAIPPVQTPPQAQTPAATPAQQKPTPNKTEPPAEVQQEDPFAEALKKAQAKSEERLADSFAGKEAMFIYGKAKDPISDRECTFEDLRARYEADFPELSDAKKVSWTVLYGKVTKTILNPGSDKVYDIKAEIEKSKTFLENIRKAKTDAEKAPECQVKPSIRAQSKGEACGLPAYKAYCSTEEEAAACDKPIVILPARDGRLYERRKTPVGLFTAPAAHLPELPIVEAGFQPALPKIPMHILMFVLNFFKRLSERYEVEALVHILYDTIHRKYTLRVPKQELTAVSVDSVMEEDYPDYLIHVMDIHSHNTMPAKFSDTDDRDEKATRLYAVAGRFDQVFPEIAVRASCGGRFIPLRPEEVFESDFKAYPYPPIWEEQLTLPEPEPLPALPSRASRVTVRRRRPWRNPDEIF